LYSKEKEIVMSKDKETHGVVVRGADGSLYFVPHHVMKSYKVPEPALPGFSDKLPAGAIAANTSISTEWMIQMLACFVQHS
jgi:hypothetical protein